MSPAIQKVDVGEQLPDVLPSKAEAPLELEVVKVCDANVLPPSSMHSLAWHSCDDELEDKKKQDAGLVLGEEQILGESSRKPA